MRILAAILAAAGLPAAVCAYPEGAPWNHAGVEGGADCTACHFDQPVTTQSERIVVEGFPARYEAGAIYPVTIRLSEAGPVNGFQMAVSGSGETGCFTPGDASTEAEGHAVRSVEPGQVWTMNWHAPQSASGPVRVWIAVNLANGDASEFGDRIHVKQIDIDF